MKAGPPRAIAGPATDPDTATPRVVPTIRLADATEVATPAIETGLPETAEVVIGGLVVPSPIPKTR